MKGKRVSMIASFGIIVLLALGCTVATTGSVNPFVTIYPRTEEGLISQTTQTPTKETLQNLTPLPTEDYIVDQGAIGTLNTLEGSLISIRDFSEIASKYLGIENLVSQSDSVPNLYAVGDHEDFIILNDDTEEHSTVTAVLRYITPHLYFWIQEGVSYNEQDVSDLATEFENKIYPTNRAYFGSEWSPGIDNDVHLYVLYTYGLGTYVGGYFSSEDQHAPAIDEFSNAHEMMYIAADGVSLSTTFAYEVLAHEFAHMINYYQDRNEDTWLSEGTAALAGYINGYSDNWSAVSYLGYHDISITDWPADMADASPYYSGAFLFTTYLSERFSSDITQLIVNSQENGLKSLEAVFSDLNLQDELLGGMLEADRVFGDWQVANYINDTRLDDGRYGYAGFDLPYTADTTEYISSCPIESQERTVYQYGVDYVEIDCSGNLVIYFSGEPVVPITDTDSYSGDYFFWSNRGNESSMTLTHDFNFSNISGEITLSYWVWYDIEEEFDYVYLLAKPEGDNWQVLSTPSCLEGKNSYGCGYTGSSYGWMEETVDLSQFAGQRIELQFEYLTDLAVTNTGFFIDDISISQIGYFTDLEGEDGGWTADGFVRIENKVPQTFELSLIIVDSNQSTVYPIEIPESQRVSIPVSIAPGENAVLVISGTAKFSLLPANYSYTITN